MQLFAFIYLLCFFVAIVATHDGLEETRGTS
jgi:hypothetical protein